MSPQWTSRYYPIPRRGGSHIPSPPEIPHHSLCSFAPFGFDYVRCTHSAQNDGGRCRRNVSLYPTNVILSEGRLRPKSNGSHNWGRSLTARDSASLAMLVRALRVRLRSLHSLRMTAGGRNVRPHLTNVILSERRGVPRSECKELWGFRAGEGRNVRPHPTNVILSES